MIKVDGAYSPDLIIGVYGLNWFMRAGLLATL